EEPGTAAQILREKGWIDDFTAHANSQYYGKDGFFTVQIGLTPEGLKYQDEIIAVVFAYIELIRQQGVDPVYYHEYKAMLEKSFNDMQMPQPLHQAIHFSATLFDIPAKNIINAPYVYTHFDQQAVQDVLQQLTPQRARIWHIHQDVEADQEIPWYEGQYRTEAFSAEQIQRWKRTVTDISLRLPEENDLFSTEKAEITPPEYLQPQQLVDEPGLEAWLTHAEYHPSEQGYIQIQFNSDLMHQGAKHWVMSDLLNRIYANETMAIRDKAGRAGIGMGIERPQDNHALTLSGYTEKHPLLYGRLLDQWFNLEVDAQSLSIAKDGFNQWLEGQKKQEPYRQLFDELNKRLKHASWPDEKLQNVLRAITLSDIEQYHQALLKHNRVRIFAFGNYSKQAVVEIADMTRDALADNWQPRERYRQTYTIPVAGESISHTDTLQHSDNALLNAWYSPEADLEIGARLALLNAVFHNSFYTQLRTNEQIGYVVGSSYDRLDDHWGFIVYAQSPNTSIDALQQRFDSYIVDYWLELQTLDDTTLEQLRGAVLAQILQPPGNFYVEYPRFLNDFYRGNDQFDTREKLIAAIAEVSKDDILTLYRTLLLEGNALRVEVALKGRDE
ncbi:MAG TPA: insulinase family protein, partial [Cellvibrionaceae bacterium]